MMRPFLILFISITLAGCNAPDNVQHYASRPSLPVIDIPDVPWSYDKEYNKHRNISTVTGPQMEVTAGRIPFRSEFWYRFFTYYSHEAGPRSRKVTAGLTTLSVHPFGPYTGRITSAISYGEEFPIHGLGAIIVKRNHLWKYVESGGWDLQVTVDSVDFELNIPASFIREFLEATPECEALAECELPL